MTGVSPTRNRDCHDLEFAVKGKMLLSTMVTQLTMLASRAKLLSTKWNCESPEKSMASQNFFCEAHVNAPDSLGVRLPESANRVLQHVVIEEYSDNVNGRAWIVRRRTDGERMATFWLAEFESEQDALQAAVEAAFEEDERNEP